MDTANDKIVGFFKKNILIIILIVTTIAYLFLDFFELNVEIKWSWYKIIGVFTINFGFGYAITEIMADEGLKAGQESPKYISALKTYGEEKIKTDAFSEMAGTFCDNYNEKQYRSALKEYYRSYNLRLDLVEQKKYVLSELTKSQQKAIKNVERRVRVIPVTPRYLFSLSNHPYRNKKTTEDIPTHEAKRKVKKIANKIVFAVTFTLIAWQFVTDPSWSNFLSSLIKVVTWLIFGAMGYFQEYQFVTQDYLPNFIIDKTDLLVEFRNEYEKGNLKPRPEEPKPPVVEETKVFNLDSPVEEIVYKITEPIKVE